MNQEPINSAPTTVPAPSSAPTAPNNVFFQLQTKTPSFISKHSTIIFVSRVVLSLILLALGIFFQVSYQPKDTFGRDIDTIQAEIAQLDAEISASATNEQSSFEQNGFSGNFFETANNHAELEFKRSELAQEIEDITAAKNSATIFATGSFYFFASALLVLAISSAIFLFSRHHTKSASIIAN